MKHIPLLPPNISAHQPQYPAIEISIFVYKTNSWHLSTENKVYFTLCQTKQADVFWGVTVWRHFGAAAHTSSVCCFRSMSTGHAPMITQAPLHHSWELRNNISVLLQWHVGGTEVRSWLNQFSVHPWGHLAGFSLYVCLLLESLSLVDPELSSLLKFKVVQTDQLLTHYACANNYF